MSEFLNVMNITAWRHARAGRPKFWGFVKCDTQLFFKYFYNKINECKQTKQTQINI